MNWKPMMSKAEAEEYTRDSYYAGCDFYHGTSQEAADSITSEGGMLTSENQNSYGEGFYFAFDRNVSVKYAGQTIVPTVISARVNVKNPKKIADSLEVEKFCDENNIPFDDFQDRKLTELLINQGFDAVEVGGNQIIVIIFDKRQIAVYKSEEV